MPFVSADLDLTLVMDDDRTLQVPSTLVYAVDNPYAVTAVFRTADGDVTWVFGRDLLDDGLIEPAGEGEHYLAHRASRWHELANLAGTVQRLFGERWQLWSRAELEERLLRSPEAHGCLVIPHAFGLHPLRYVRGLATAASRRGAMVCAGTPVLAWQRAGGRHQLSQLDRRVLERRSDPLHRHFAPHIAPRCHHLSLRGFTGSALSGSSGQACLGYFRISSRRTDG